MASESNFRFRLSGFFIFLLISLILIITTIFIFLSYSAVYPVKKIVTSKPLTKSSWQTFSNNAYSFDYPPDWNTSGPILIGSGSKTDFTGPDLPNLTKFEISDRFYPSQPPLLTYTEFINQQSFPAPVYSHVIRENITLGNWTGTRFTFYSKVNKHLETLIILAASPTSTRILTLDYIHSDLENKSSLPPTLVKILSTFQFIGPSLTPAPLNSLPSITLISPFQPQTLKLHQKYLIKWQIKYPPIDKSNWTVLGNILSDYVAAAESKNGLQIFSFPLTSDPGQFNWTVVRSFADSWFQPDSLNATINDVHYHFKICIVNKNDQEYPLGYYSSSSSTFFCNSPDNPIIIHIVSP